MSLGELAKIFLYIGATGFGGPVALVAYMEQEFCERRKVLTTGAFNETYVLCKLLPGPVAYQVALSIGSLLRGRFGGLVAGLSLLLPSFLMMLALSAFYSQVQRLAGFESVAEGLRAGALVVIVDSVLRMARPYRTKAEFWIFAAAGASCMALWPRAEPLIILLGGLSMVLAARFRPGLKSLGPLFWVHFKAGAFTFGTGLAIIPILQHESVDVYRWLTQGEFLDGMAFGQMTPGPITISSVFIGYRAAGFSGAIAAFVGIYLPGALIVLGLLPGLRKRLTGKPALVAFQKGAIPTVIGCILAASVVFGLTVVSTPRTAFLFVLLSLVALRWKVPAWALIGAGGVVSLFLNAL
jgi:chromate transporter